VADPRYTTLMVVLSGVRVSSGASMLLDSALAMAVLLSLFLGPRRVLSGRTSGKGLHRVTRLRAILASAPRVLPPAEYNQNAAVRFAPVTGSP
jgi:hypothetical protein